MKRKTFVAPQHKRNQVLKLDSGRNALRFAEHGVDFRILLLGMLRRGEMWKILPCFLLLAGCTQPRHDWMEHVAQNTSKLLYSPLPHPSGMKKALP